MTSTQTPTGAELFNNPQHIAIINRIMDLKFLSAGRKIDVDGKYELAALEAAANCYNKPNLYSERQQQAVKVLYSVATRGPRDVAYIRCLGRVADLLCGDLS